MSNNSYRKDYMKRRYNSDTEFKKKVLASVKKYACSEKGKRNRLKSKQNFVKKHPKYFSDYMAKRKIIAKQNKICVLCFKKKVFKEYSMCKKCLSLRKAYFKKRRLMLKNGK